MTEIDDRHVVLLATGGTIASRETDPGKGSVAADTGGALLSSTGQATAVPVRVVDVFQRGSYALTFDDMLTICRTIRDVLTDPLVLGVVVTHGTDTMEDTAFLADIVHADPRPVVFTGAQNSADSANPDGPENLRQAIAVAASPAAADRGALICFAGKIFPARGVRKAHTIRLDAFANPDFGTAGTVSVGEASTSDLVSIESPAPRRSDSPLPLPASDDPEPPRVDVIPTYPGADRTLIDAAVRAGAKGIVLQATGTGNANLALCQALEEAINAGVTVVTSTRVDAGPVVPVYGAGGGLDLESIGAIPSGLLRPSQAFILLNLLLRLDADRASILAGFSEYGAPAPSNHSSQ